MTCIVGLVENGIVYMGGDSAACDDSSLNIIRGSKVFKKGEFLFGISGNPRMSDILRYNFEIPYKLDDDQDILEYMHRYFIPDLKGCLSENGVLIKQDEIVSSDSWVMIGYQGRLFILQSYFHLSESLLNYNALGSGMDAALGCLYGVENLMNRAMGSAWILKATPEEKLKLALRASEKFNCNVKGPFTILSTAQQD
jgi:hypothetical protein